MKRILLAACALFGLLVSIAAAAVAPTPVGILTDIQGTVLINQGERYVTATPGMSINAGDRIVVQTGAHAEILFSGDNCALPLEQEVMVTVPSRSTCAGGVADIRRVSPSTGQAVGGSATEPTVVVAKEETHRRALYWWLGGSAVAAAILINQNRDHNNEPTASR